jgi:alanine dehydrogenase
VLEPGSLTDSIERAFRARGLGAVAPGGVLGVEMAEGGFHIKAAALSAERGIFAAKLNGNFPGNPASSGLPTIQGLVLAVDVATGTPRAVMESSALTRLRTAAASAVAIRHLARPDADRATLIGCGVQAFDQLRFAHAARVMRSITLFDPRVDMARALAMRIEQELGIMSHVADDLPAAARAGAGAIIITCTTSRTPFLEPAMVAAGTLVVAVGADNPHKVELAPALLAASKVVTDDTAQCAMIGDLHHAIAAGAMRREDVHAELGEVVAGTRPGRASRDERIVFDSTGIPIQDAAAAELVLARLEGMDDVQHFTFRS